MNDAIDIKQTAWMPYDEIARHYDQLRPGYPSSAIQELVDRLLRLQPVAPIVADVGCGTGIFTRLLAAHLDDQYEVVGVEPSEKMRERAIDTTPASTKIQYLRAPAEQLPFKSSHTAGIAAAGAAQLFDRSKFYPESARCLADGGLLALVQNKRRHQETKFFQRYEQFLSDFVPGYRTGTYADCRGTHSPAHFADELLVTWN